MLESLQAVILGKRYAMYLCPRLSSETFCYSQRTNGWCIYRENTLQKCQSWTNLGLIFQSFLRGHQSCESCATLMQRIRNCTGQYPLWLFTVSAEDCARPERWWCGIWRERIHFFFLGRPSDSLVLWFSFGPPRTGSCALQLHGILWFIVVQGLELKLSRSQ